MTHAAGATDTSESTTGRPGASAGGTDAIHHTEHRRRMSVARLWRIVRMPLLLLVVGGAIYAFRARPLEVRTHTVERGPIVPEVMGTGTLEARIKAMISPKISGRVAQVLVDQGDRVTSGQLLVQLDDAELLEQVEIASASVAVAQAALERLKAEKDRAVAVLGQADFDYKRTSKLYEQDTAASIEFERATESLGIARAELARAEAAIIEGQKELITEEKTLAYHQARLADTEVKAPFDGLIVRRHRDPGDVVVPGSPVLTLISTDELWISAWVDETELARLGSDQPARVVFRSEPEHAYPGRVARIGREADRETRELIIDVRLLELPDNWAVGQRAEVYVETDRRQDVVLLPAEYIDLRTREPGVFVQEEGRAVWRDIEIGLRGRRVVEVAQGLQAGDTVVVTVDATAALSEGRRIEPVP